ncbi:tetratricopeptide repeat protein [candidate division CSSED10-310 bacterium]|uniref:Tetratricopeptide repeat protein n=1 Tax=candidate division CSSED10-310 bacterium TaxID=2855610 RepID=A0ABV6YUN1_UNCC1
MREEQDLKVRELKDLKQKEKLLRKINDEKNLVRNLEKQVLMLDGLGDYDAALHVCKEWTKIAYKLIDDREILTATGNQALMYKKTGFLNEALMLNFEVEEMARRVGDHRSLAAALINKAIMIDENMGKTETAIPFAEEALQICMDKVGDSFLEKEIRKYLLNMKRKGGGASQL